jgi:peptidoglycan/xylan/chitin deacetylase (PgdA/CDA1 family)
MRLLWRSSAVAVLLLLAVGWGAVAAADPAVKWHGPRDEKVVALTFDDGWSTPRCQKILDILVKERVEATFFPNALYVKQHPDFWRKVAALGFPIGNHTVNHKDLTKMTGAGVFKEVNRDREIVEQIVGVPMIRAMRPPFGAYDKRTLRQSAKAGFPTLVLWDVTALDTSRRASKKAMTRAALSGRSGSIVVLHCGPKETPQILPRIIKGYRARGFEFVTIPTLLGIDAPSRALHRPWAWSLLHSATPPVIVAAAECRPQAAVNAASERLATPRLDWRRTGWSRRPTSGSCISPDVTALSLPTTRSP